MSKRVLSIGQCSADHGSIGRLLQAQFAAQMTAAEGESDALAQLRRGAFDLVLVNRVLDADGADGLEIVRSIKADPQLAILPVMLVTNYPEFQQQAVAAGAVEGFGKAELSSPATRQRLAAYLE